MESIGASERVMEYLDREIAPQLCKGRILPDFQGKVGICCHAPPHLAHRSHLYNPDTHENLISQCQD